MEFLELVERRYSCRAFQPKEVEREKLDAVLEAARLAPSAVNLQPWKFYVVTSAEVLRSLHSVYAREWFQSAPACIVACGNHAASWKRSDGKDHCDIDVAIAAEHMVLAAAELGLGSCWVCNFDVAKCASILQLPDDLEPIVMIPIGYAADEAKPKKRKATDEVVEYV